MTAIFKKHDRNHSENQKTRTGLAGGLIGDPAFQDNRPFFQNPPPVHPRFINKKPC